LIAEPVRVLVDVAAGRTEYRVFAKQMTNPPAAYGSSTKSVIAKSATTKSVQDDANRGETPK